MVKSELYIHTLIDRIITEEFHLIWTDILINRTQICLVKPEPYVQHDSEFLSKETYLSLTHTVSTFVIFITEVVFRFKRNN